MYASARKTSRFSTNVMNCIFANARYVQQKKEITMNLNLSIAPLISLIAGILILVVPKLLNYIVALYLIVIGLIGLFGVGGLHLR